MSALYKVLTADGRSAHGGNLQWSLPHGTPGEWHEVDGDLEMCSRGLHLTDDPARWMREDCIVYEAEGEDEHGRQGDKTLFRRARLLRRVEDSALASLRIFMSGRHEVTDGHCWASGNAVLVVAGSASVVALGSSRVVALGSSRVVARDSSSVVAWDSSSVVAWDSSSVEARGSSRVEAWGSSRVVAWDSASILTWSAIKSLALHGPLAVHIDRSGMRAVCTVGDAERSP